MKYLSWQEKNILIGTGGKNGNEDVAPSPSEKEISEMYAHGFVFTRIAKGVMQQTRAVRIDLKKFELSSENRRILRKIATLNKTCLEKKDAGVEAAPSQDTSSDIEKFLPHKNNGKSVIFDGVTKKEEAGTVDDIAATATLPLAATDYHWSIAKLAKDFYEKKFGAGIMSAAKIKELLTDGEKSNFNFLINFSNLGYVICYKNSTILHYSYPFYDLSEKAALPKDMGLGMMILAVDYAQKAGLDYIYLGSLQRPGDTYKLQFKGLEWFDGGPAGTGTWQADIEKVKTILK